MRRRGGPAAPARPAVGRRRSRRGHVSVKEPSIFADFFVRPRLIDQNDAAATFTNIADSEFLFRLGLVGFLIVFVADVVVAWALCILFRAVSQEVSLLTAWFRIVCADPPLEATQS